MEAIAKLNNEPTSPRKMRLLADLIRGMKVEKALAVLEHSTKHPAVPLRKLVLSAINNWQQKNEGEEAEGLIIKTIMVDGARVIKRMRPAPQGRGYRVRKRSNHVTLSVDMPGGNKSAEANASVEEEETPKATKKAAPKKAAAKKTATKKATTKKATADKATASDKA